MVTDTEFREQVGQELDRVFGAEHVVRDAMVDASTGEIMDQPERTPRPRQGVLPTFEGVRIHNYRLAFGGTIDLSQFSDQGRDLIAAAQFARPVTLTITGMVTAVNGRYRETEKSGAEVTRVVRVAVERVEVPE